MSLIPFGNDLTRSVFSIESADHRDFLLAVGWHGAVTMKPGFSSIGLPQGQRYMISLLSYLTVINRSTSWQEGHELPSLSYTMHHIITA